jgi:hypothetical protein
VCGAEVPIRVVARYRHRCHGATGDNGPPSRPSLLGNGCAGWAWPSQLPVAWWVAMRLPVAMLASFVATADIG